MAQLPTISPDQADLDMVVAAVLQWLKLQNPYVRSDFMDQIHRQYCRYCAGTDGNSCPCWNDE